MEHAQYKYQNIIIEGGTFAVLSNYLIIHLCYDVGFL